jgi:hypothetical protein
MNEGLTHHSVADEAKEARKFVIVGDICITEIEMRNLRNKKLTYKIVNKQWYRLIRKNGTAKKVRMAKNAIKLLEKKIAKLQEMVDGKGI